MGELQHLPNDLRARIKNTLDHAVLPEELPRLDSGFDYYDPGLKRSSVSIGLPGRFMDTEIESYVLAHEFFHHIQFEAVAKSTGKDIMALRREQDIPLRERLMRQAPDETMEARQILDTFFSMAETAEGRYLIEAGAIMAEWKLLRLIPDARREALLKLIRDEPGLEEKTRRLLLRVFQPPPATAREYLEREHAAGRYSWEVIIEKLRSGSEF